MGYDLPVWKRKDLISYVAAFVLEKLWPDEVKVQRFAEWYADEFPRGDKNMREAWDYYCLNVETR